MKLQESMFKPALLVVAGALLLASPLSNVVAAEGAGSDAAFNGMVQGMAGQDTGSIWFDNYVEGVNQQIAAQDSGEAYGAAGPSAPQGGFEGYLGTFVRTDTGSMWFDSYVDSVQHILKAKGY